MLMVVCCQYNNQRVNYVKETGFDEMENRPLQDGDHSLMRAAGLLLADLAKSASGLTVFTRLALGIPS